MKKKVLIIAGEPSGDLHGAGLIQELKKINPDIEYSGVGGNKLKQEGTNLLYSIEKLSFMGFYEVLKNLKVIRELKKKLLDFIDRDKPDLVILIDYPGFNLRFAREIKKRGILILYYISPQIWAWGKKRIKTIKELVDRMIVFFPFEEKLYKDAGVEVNFIGHPLLDLVKPSFSKDEFQRKSQLTGKEILIGLLPGSRWQEIEKVLPVMARACLILKKRLPNLRVAIGLAPNINRERLQVLLKKLNLEAIILEDLSYDLMSHSDLLLATSGTATLESAISGTPLIVLYKTSLFTYLLAKTLVKIPNIGMVNIVAGEKIVPEFIQFEAEPERIAQEMEKILTDKGEYERIKRDLATVKYRLGEKGAYQRGARIVNQMLSQVFL
ncbi:MAG: lipid-A-disaccharide synthase [candidate division Zixibacteria bacterium]|nr:lipid-A-disaccharide synthase [candidate division Zixibacteria bacterium]